MSFNNVFKAISQTLKESDVGKHIAETTKSLQQELQHQINKVNAEKNQATKHNNEQFDINNYFQKASVDNQSININDYMKQPEQPKISKQSLERENTNALILDINDDYQVHDYVSKKTTSQIQIDNLTAKNDKNISFSSVLSSDELPLPLTTQNETEQVETNKEKHIDNMIKQTLREAEASQGEQQEHEKNNNQLTSALNYIKGLNKNHLIDIVLKGLGAQNSEFKDPTMMSLARKKLEILRVPTLMLLAQYLIMNIFRLSGWGGLIISIIGTNVLFNFAKKTLTGSDNSEGSKEREIAQVYLKQEQEKETKNEQHTRN